MSNRVAAQEAFERISASMNSGSSQRRQALKNRRFTIVSNDCWGAEVYKDLGLPYQTPLIGTFVMGPCYMALVVDAPRILTSPLEFIESSRYEEINRKRAEHWYPVGRLAGGVEIQFLHYKSVAEAADKWARRVKRSHFDALFFKLSGDKDRFTDVDLAAFDALAIAKVALSAEPHPGLRSVITIPEYVPDGKAMYAISLRYFDVVRWLNRAGYEN